MGHRHSRPKVPHKDVPTAVTVRSDTRRIHIGRTQRDTSIQPHRRSTREPRLLSELPSEYARCADVGRDASPIEPQTKSELVPPPVDPPQYKLDSLGPLESFNGSIRDSGSSERGEETLTTPQVQIQGPPSARRPGIANFVEQSHALITPRETIEDDPTTPQLQSQDASSAQGPEIADFFKQFHAPLTPSHVLVSSAGSSTAARSNDAPPVPTLR
ncbi:hypothetical protein M436DRAFT_85020 [Aureobasidium namibiae CBS 147.97]|uniref:Uncharacterized protein n=1 Tax=Aureobasidium namibiae CBS 147.97 TaxID=1043004 RepID=A0A074WEK0_9PEZI|nr:uncharacterized protein M436DRAFT_85020 [Aureobasidium namibiae CBS 147.97]KEQ69974.1 hypothetical protein M436DRAFT_85020 [Aureobasidium namibiae CBS 147.97]